MSKTLVLSAVLAATCSSALATTAFVADRGQSPFLVTDLRPDDGIEASYGGIARGAIQNDHYADGPATSDYVSGIYILNTFGPGAMAAGWNSFYAADYVLTPYSSVTVGNSFFAGLSRATNPGETGYLNLGFTLNWADSNEDGVEVNRTLTFGETFDGVLSGTIINDSPLPREFWWSSGFNMHLDTPVTAPVPEPETYALMLAGLGLVGWKFRRTRQPESMGRRQG